MHRVASRCTPDFLSETQWRVVGQVRKAALKITAGQIRSRQFASTSASSSSSRLAEWTKVVQEKVHTRYDSVSLARVQGLHSAIDIPSLNASSFSESSPFLKGGSLILFLPVDVPTSDLGRDGAERFGPFVPPSDSPLERMWVAGGWEFPEDGIELSVGDDVVCESTVESVKERVGKDGRAGIYITQMRTIRPKGDTRVNVIERRTHLYRPPLPSSPISPSLVSEAVIPSTPKPRKQPDFSITVLPTPPMLFRFSAVTFNTHRIHWDRDYCVNVEGREDLIVHGPLTALLLIHTLTKHLPPTSRIASFDYRAVSPLAVNRPVRFCGVRKDEGKFSLWVEDEKSGKVFMSGEGQTVPIDS